MSEVEVTLRWNISSADEPLHLNIINVVKLDSESFCPLWDPLMCPKSQISSFMAAMIVTFHKVTHC